MSTVPPEAPPSPDQQEPGDTGPRVTRDEMKDLGRIRRSRTDRKVAGVAAGIARHLDVDPLLVRVGFVLLVIFGGAGILAYGACWLLVPEDDTEDAVIRVDDRTRTVILAIVAVASAVALIGDSVGEWGFPWPLAVGAVVLAVVMGSKGRRRQHPFSVTVPPGTPGTASGPPLAGGPAYVGYRPPVPPVPPRPADPRKRGPILFFFTLALAALLVGVVGTIDLAGADLPAAAYPATVLATCGLMLVVGAFYGRAGGLILLGLVTALATAVTTVADDVSAGQVSRTPRTAAALGDSYELGFGEILIDLREVEDLEGLDGRTLDLDLAVGHIEVILPDPGLDVVVHTDIDGEGRAMVFGDEQQGGGQLDSAFDGGPGDIPQLTINADLSFGEIEIYTEEVAR